MRTFILILSLIAPLSANAQTPVWQPPPAAINSGSSVDTARPITGELDQLFGSLSQQLQSIDAMTARLKSLTAKTPDVAKTEIEAAAKTLSDFVDKLRPDREMASQIAAMRSAAATHRKRVEDLSKETLTEQDRTALLSTWKRVGENIDKLDAKMGEVRENISNSLKTLRMRQAAIGEYLLVGQFEAAIASLQSWVSNLESTVSNLKSTLNANRPAM